MNEYFLWPKSERLYVITSNIYIYAVAYILDRSSYTYYRSEILGMEILK